MRKSSRGLAIVELLVIIAIIGIVAAIAIPSLMRAQAFKKFQVTFQVNPHTPTNQQEQEVTQRWVYRKLDQLKIAYGSCLSDQAAHQRELEQHYPNSPQEVTNILGSMRVNAKRCNSQIVELKDAKWSAERLGYKSEPDGPVSDEKAGPE